MTLSSFEKSPLALKPGLEAFKKVKSYCFIGLLEWHGFIRRRFKGSNVQCKTNWNGRFFM